MRFLFRAIAAGVLIGAALFFVPFIFGFFFFILFSFIIFRLIAGPRRHRGYWRHDYYGMGITSIDGNRYNSSINRGGPERHFTVQ